MSSEVCFATETERLTDGGLIMGNDKHITFEGITDELIDAEQLKRDTAASVVLLHCEPMEYPQLTVGTHWCWRVFGAVETSSMRGDTVAQILSRLLEGTVVRVGLDRTDVQRYEYKSADEHIWLLRYVPKQETAEVALTEEVKRLKVQRRKAKL